MSALIEYAKLALRAMENPSEVVEGWVNVVKAELGALPQDQLEEVVRRRLICGSCEFMNENALMYKSKRKDKHCILCSCPIQAKSASMISDCGIKYWNEKHPDKAMELKWTSYGNKD